MACGSEHVIAVQLNKTDADLTVLCPYFEAFVPASQGALAATAALRQKHPDVAHEDGPPTSYVSEFHHKNAGLNMYFSSSPSDATNLATYDWMESLSYSRKCRFRPAGEASRTTPRSCDGASAKGSVQICVGAPEEEEEQEHEPPQEYHRRAEPDAHLPDDSPREHGSRKDGVTNDVVFGISNVRNVFYIALHAPVDLRHVEIMVLSRVTLRARDDVRHPLRMCRLHHVTGDTYDTAVDWITRKRTSLLQGLLSLTEDGCEAPLGSALRRGVDGSPVPDCRRTFLHVIAEHLGDPRFARMLVKHCSRFLRKDEKEVLTGRSALHSLFVDPLTLRAVESTQWRGRVVDVNSGDYFRTLELLRLLVEEVQVNLDDEDIFGNTVVHYAACGHRRGSAFLPLLLMMGAPPASTNLDGKTPAEEMLHRQRTHDLKTWDVDEGLDILAKYTDRPFAPLMLDDSAQEVAEKSSSNENAELQQPAADASLAAVAQQRRHEVSLFIGHGVDLPRVPVKLVDVVPLKIRPLGADVIRSFPMPVIEVDETGYPVASHHASANRISSASERAADMVSLSSGDNDAHRHLELARRSSSVVDGKSPCCSGVEDAAAGSAISHDTLELLKAEFSALDRDGEGWIPVSDMRRVYLSFDGYGVAESTAEIDKMISVMGIRKDGKVTFDEYCILMLRMNRL